MLEPVNSVRISTDELLDKFDNYHFRNMINTIPVQYTTAVEQIVCKYPWLGRRNLRIAFTDASWKKLQQFIAMVMPRPISSQLWERPWECGHGEVLDCIREMGGLEMGVRLGRSIPHKLSIVGKIAR